MDFWSIGLDYFAAHPWTQALAGVAAMVLLALGANWATRRVLLRSLEQALEAAKLGGAAKFFHRTVTRLAYVVPAIVLHQGVALVPHLPPTAVFLTQKAATAVMIATVALALDSVLSLFNEVYRRRPEARSRPIKGYLQVVKIALYAGSLVLIIAALMERSPLLLLSGLGAMAAVLMLVFKDTILSLVASVQLTSNDMIRVGDWIEMPQVNANGDVIDIALHTVKVQNFDKTITTIPTYRLISESFKNWRGMTEFGARRIMRPLYIDQKTIRFLRPDEAEALRRFRLIDQYLQRKLREIADWNARFASQDPQSVNARRITNVGTFRAYVQRYLEEHPRINKNALLMVRQLEPGPEGLPLQLYCFTDTTDWTQYEGIQSDIFDHLLAILPEFDLRLYQKPSGTDLRIVADQIFGGRTGTEAPARPVP